MRLPWSIWCLDAYHWWVAGTPRGTAGTAGCSHWGSIPCPQVKWGARRGFSTGQWVKSVTLLSDHNWFTVLSVDHNSEIDEPVETQIAQTSESTLTKELPWVSWHGWEKRPPGNLLLEAWEVKKQPDPFSSRSAWKPLIQVRSKQWMPSLTGSYWNVHQSRLHQGPPVDHLNLDNSDPGLQHWWYPERSQLHHWSSLPHLEVQEPCRSDPVCSLQLGKTGPDNGALLVKEAQSGNRLDDWGGQDVMMPAVLYPALDIPPGSRWSGRNPGRSEQNGRNLVGIQVNSNPIPSKNNLIIQTQIFIHSRSFQVESK